MSRINFAAPRRGREDEPLRGLIYGPEKVGKSSFAADAPRPLFFDPTRGTSELDVDRVPYPEDGSDYQWEDVVDLVDWMRTGEHDYETLVLDELGKIESLCWEHICKVGKKHHIEDFGYGKGYEIAIREWRIFLAGIERMQRERGVNVLILAHSKVNGFRNPEGADFDRYEPDAHRKLVGLLKQWCSFVFFARYEELVDERGDRTKRTRGVSTGRRVIHTVRKAAFDAGNRYDLPEELPLSWAEFDQARRGPNTAPLLEELERLANASDDETAEAVRSAIQRAGGDAGKLARLVDWARSKTTTTKDSTA